METRFVCRLDAFQDLDWNSISHVVLNLLLLIVYLKHWKNLVGKPLWQIHKRGTSVESLKYKPMNIHIRSELTKGISFFNPRHFKWNICKKKRRDLPCCFLPQSIQECIRVKQFREVQSLWHEAALCYHVHPSLYGQSPGHDTSKVLYGVLWSFTLVLPGKWCLDDIKQRSPEIGPMDPGLSEVFV